jgi:hypothetical protein
MRGHGSGQKAKWFSRLRPGAGEEASRPRPSVFDSQAQSTRTGSLKRLLVALRLLWIFTTLRPAHPSSPPASKSKATPSGQSDASSAGATRDYEQARQENLEAETRLKMLQAQSLEDERSLLSLRRREHELNIENAEIRRGLSLAGVVVFGAALVAGVALGAVDPGISQSVPKSFELWRLLLGK